VPPSPSRRLAFGPLLVVAFLASAVPALAGNGKGQSQFAFSTDATSVNEGAGAVVLTILRTGDTCCSTAGVTITTANGSALSGSDYSSVSTTRSFGPGVTEQTVNVPIIDDGTDEPNETFTAELSNPSDGENATVGQPEDAIIGQPSSIQVTILDNDVPGPGTLRFVVSGVSVGEGAGSAVLDVHRFGGSSGTVGASFISNAGSATAGSDYSHVSGEVSFADGVTTRTITVPILQDANDESDETFSVALSNPTGGATLGNPSQLVVSIVDDDPAHPGVLAFSVDAVEVGEGGTQVTLSVQRSIGTSGTVGATFTTSAGSAAAGSDYTHSVGTISLPNGITVTTLSVPVLQDALDEPNEAFTVTLSSPSGGATLGAPSSTTVTIVDDDAPPPGSLSFSAANVNVDEDAGNVTLTVIRNGGTTGAVGATVTTSGGSATSDADFSAVNEAVLITDSDSSTTFTVPILQDTDDEPNETFTVTLSEPTGGATLAEPNPVTVTILDEDGPASVAFNVSAHTAREDSVVQVAVLRSGAAEGEISVTLARSGTASIGDVSAPTMVTLPPGVLFAAVGMIVEEDALAEAEETMIMTLTDPTGGATVGEPGTHTLTIPSSDVQPDAMIARHAAGPYRGNNIYAPPGPQINILAGDGQTMGGNGTIHSDVIRWVKIEHDAPGTVTLLLRRSVASRPGLRVRAYLGATEITGDLEDDFEIAVPAGQYISMRLVLRFTSVLPSGEARSVKIWAKHPDGRLRDAVTARLRYI
jgi:hypothetical protein